MPLQNFKTLNGIYRGIVVYNEDPKYSGRVKIYVPGIYPIEFKNQHELLPWAEPAMSLEGGSWANEKVYSSAVNSFNPVQNKDEQKAVDNSTADQNRIPIKNDESNNDKKIPDLNAETGYCSVPHAGKYATDGAQVFLFFEAGDPNKPVYFAAAQSGLGWFSEHPNQHVFHSDNIRVRIDEEPSRKESSCWFETYNSNCVKQMLSSVGPQAFLSPSDIEESVFTPELEKTKLDIEVFSANKDDISVHLKVTGRVNVHIDGDIYLEHVGNKYETHIGNRYLHHVGDEVIQREGNITNIHTGNLLSYQQGMIEKTLIGNRIESEEGDFSKLRVGNEIRVNKGTENQTTEGSVTILYKDTYARTIIGASNIQHIGTVTINLLSSLTETIIGPVSKNWANTFTHIVGGAWTATTSSVLWIVNGLFTFK